MVGSYIIKRRVSLGRIDGILGGAGWWAAIAAYRPMDKDVDVHASCCCSSRSVGSAEGGRRDPLWRAANALQNKLTRAQYRDEVTWTTKSWLGLQKQRISVVLHTAIAEQVVNE